ALVLADAGSKLLPARPLQGGMGVRGMRGRAREREDGTVEETADAFPAGVEVHVLRKPLQMQQVFRAVAEALG
ncbi:hybrid sensor histidine kinase/response regulator, partial [Stenotrophomonas muris]